MTEASKASMPSIGLNPFTDEEIQAARGRLAKQARVKRWARLALVAAVLVASIAGGYFYWNETVRFQKETAAAERAGREMTEWQVALQLNTISAFESFLKNYQDSRFAPEAAKQISELRKAEQSDWSRAADENSVSSYTAYVGRWPSGRFSDEAERRIRRLNTADQIAWDRTEKANNETAYRRYLSQFPRGLYAEAARGKIREGEAPRETLDWQKAERVDTANSYEDYLRRWPRGIFYEEATRRLNFLKEENALWQQAVGKDAREPYERYLEKYPAGKNASEAARRLKELLSMQPLVSEAESALKEGHEFQECAVCPRMVVVPAGDFTMGSPQTEMQREASDNEGPERKVKIAQRFAVGKYEVTFDQWDSCVADGGCRGYRPGDSGWGRGKLPVMNVSWDDAKLYAIEQNGAHLSLAFGDRMGIRGTCRLINEILLWRRFEEPLQIRQCCRRIWQRK